MSESPLPLDDVSTPNLDGWDARLGGGWDAFVCPYAGASIHVEMLDLEVPPTDVLYAFEIRLDVHQETAIRETVRNSHLAVAVADALAANWRQYCDEWEEGLAPRPDDVGELPER